jgi:hypothetical protein
MHWTTSPAIASDPKVTFPQEQRTEIMGVSPLSPVAGVNQV